MFPTSFHVSFFFVICWQKCLGVDLFNTKLSGFACPVYCCCFTLSFWFSVKILSTRSFAFFPVCFYLFLNFCQQNWWINFFVVFFCILASVCICGLGTVCVIFSCCLHLHFVCTWSTGTVLFSLRFFSVFKFFFEQNWWVKLYCCLFLRFGRYLNCGLGTVCVVFACGLHLHFVCTWSTGTTLFSLRFFLWFNFFFSKIGESNCFVVCFCVLAGTLICRLGAVCVVFSCGLHLHFVCKWFTRTTLSSLRFFSMFNFFLAKLVSHTLLLFVSVFWQVLKFMICGLLCVWCSCFLLLHAYLPSRIRPHPYLPIPDHSYPLTFIPNPIHGISGILPVMHTQNIHIYTLPHPQVPFLIVFSLQHTSTHPTHPSTPTSNHNYIHTYHMNNI